jgi:hypothetical protein
MDLYNPYNREKGTEIEALLCTIFKAVFRVFLAAAGPYRSGCTAAVWHRFKSAGRGQGRTAVWNFWAHFPRQKFGTDCGCCKLIFSYWKLYCCC